MFRKLGKAYRLLFKKRSALPEVFWFEVTNRCNLDCGMCPRQKINAPIKDMGMDVFKSALDKIPSARHVFLTGWGEPLAHKDFPDMVSMVRKKLPKAGINFTTNGYLLTKENISKVIGMNVAKISVSIEKISPDNGDSWPGHPVNSGVVENIKELISQRAGRKFPVVRIQTVMLKNQWKELSELITFSGDAGIDEIALIRPNKFSEALIERPGFEEELDIIRRARLAAARAGVKLVSLNSRNILSKIFTHFDRYCPWTDNIIYINVDGEATPCCNLRGLQFGSLVKMPLKDVWNSEGFSDFYKNQGSYCRGCDSIKFRQVDRC